MTMKGKLELTWVGKDERPRLEPRVLVEDPSKSYGDPKTQNMLIFGDNLLALKALEQDFAGKIKCIYIDPPYNTGTAFEHYDDGIEHSLWISLMRDRLELLRDLLTEDGSIWVNLDDNEGHYCKVLMDEVFGRANFRATITWQRKYSVSNNFKGIATICDYILVFSKSAAFRNNLLPRSQESIDRYSNPDNDPRGPWKAVDYLNQATPEQRRNLCYDITNPNTGEVIKNTKKAWKYDPTTHAGHVTEKRLWWGRDGKNTVPALKLFLSEVRDGMTPHNWWPHDEVGHTDEAKKEGIQLFGAENVFGTPKPERLLKRIMEIASNPGDWVLDSFAGSGTTGAVAHKMGRKWIMVELGEHCHTHIIPRLQKVIDGTDQGGISEAVGWKGGGGFKYYRLAESLLVRDKELSTENHPVYVINPRYDETLLIRGICKIAGFKYRNDGRLHGISSESRFLHVTTRLVTQMYLDSLGEDISKNQSLVIYCTRRVGKLTVPDNIEIRKIPRDLLDKCDFEEDK